MMMTHGPKLSDLSSLVFFVNFVLAEHSNQEDNSGRTLKKNREDTKSIPSLKKRAFCGYHWYHNFT